MALSGVYPISESRITLETADTSALYTPGNSIRDNLGGLWTYVKASGAITVYDLVYVTGAAIPIAASATASLLTTTASYMIGIAQVAAADTNYLWVWRGIGGGIGHGIKVNVNGSTVLNVKVYGTSTAGAVDDAVTAPLIQGLQMCATTASGAGEVYASTLLSCNCQD